MVVFISLLYVEIRVNQHGYDVSFYCGFGCVGMRCTLFIGVLFGLGYDVFSLYCGVGCVGIRCILSL